MPNYHALLIGIDRYPTRPLSGCVNDVRAVRALLQGPRFGLDPAHIVQLTAAKTSPMEPLALRPTVANVRAALQKLGSSHVAPGDRVYIHFSGHGTRAPIATPTAGPTFREALALLADDPDSPYAGVLYDYELNTLIRAICQRTSSVALCLDCCHSTGATREVPGAQLGPNDFVARYLPPPPTIAPLPPTQAFPLDTRDALGCAVPMDQAVIAAACQSHERAGECSDKRGIVHGAFTLAICQALDGLADAKDLRQVSWSRIWPEVLNGLQETRGDRQHPWLIGSMARKVIAGPPDDEDRGIAITPSDGHYTLSAGTLSGLTPGALIAVYGERPRRFPRLDTVEDRTARRGLLRVVHAERTKARALLQGPPFDWPASTRGRLVAPGAPQRLTCALLPEHPQIRHELERSPYLRVAPPNPTEARPTETEPTEVRLVQQPGGQWSLQDALHPESTSALLQLSAGATPQALRAVLEQYFIYSGPLRAAAQCTDQPGMLQLSLLQCPAQNLDPETAQRPDLPLASGTDEYGYALASGTHICLRVHNHTSHPLRATVFNSAASGRVELLGSEVVENGSHHVFWRDGQLGVPFEIGLPAGRQRGIERITVIGTPVDRALEHLKSDISFEAASRLSGTRDLQGGAPAPSTELWASTQVVLRTSRSD